MKIPCEVNKINLPTTRLYVLYKAPRNFGGSAIFFLPNVFGASTAAGDGCDRRGFHGALAGQCQCKP